jgi:ectoine hydroxylase-related dioxygenase (phytanoyl-CoA dioxygenase family)
VNENSSQLAAQFHADGFVIVRGLFSTDEIRDVERELDRYLRDIVPALPAGDVYREDSASRPIKSLFRMDQRSEFFNKLKADARLLSLMRAIWPGDEVIQESVMFFGKPAGDGSDTPPHQDNAFQCWSPPLALTATLSIDESTPENGALICQRGSHDAGLLPHCPSGVMGFSRRLVEPLDTSRYPEVQLCMTPGDVALHQIQTVHRSGPNPTARPRRQLGIGYRSSAAARDAVAFEKYQRDLHSLHRSAAAK